MFNPVKFYFSENESGENEKKLKQEIKSRKVSYKFSMISSCKTQTRRVKSKTNPAGRQLARVVGLE